MSTPDHPEDVAVPAGSTRPSSLDRQRELEGRRWDPWLRRAGLLAMLLLVGVALTGRLGPVERVSAVSGHPAARIDLRAPTVLRAGLLWRARITIRAHRRIRDPQLVLGAGYVERMQLNTIEPAPVDETTRGDALAFTYPTLEAGDRLTVYLQLQVNPTTVGREDLSVALYGEGIPDPPVRLPAQLTILP